MPNGENGGKARPAPLPRELQSTMEAVLAKSKNDANCTHSVEAEQWYQSLPQDTKLTLDTGIKSIITDLLHIAENKAYDAAMNPQKSKKKNDAASPAGALKSPPPPGQNRDRGDRILL